MKKCDAARRCNSCQLTNLSYAEQLRFKENKCRRALGDLCPVEAITPSAPDRYRNKAQFVFRQRDRRTIESGIYKSAVMTVAAVDDCMLCSERANEIARTLRRLLVSFKIRPFDPYSGRGWLRSVTVRESSAGECMVILTGVDAVLPAKATFTSALIKACPFITTVVLTVCAHKNLSIGKTAAVLYGDGTITDTLLDRTFRLSPSAFYQINHDQCERLYTKVIELADLTPDATLLDAYCGVGTIGICCAPYAGSVIAVEQNTSAVRDARHNAALNGIDNITFTAADAKDYLRDLCAGGTKIDAAVIDPPRAGCAASFLNALAKLAPERIVYVSCCVETQARDIRILRRLGYRAERCFPFDMFPQTNHVESVVRLSRER